MTTHKKCRNVSKYPKYKGFSRIKTSLHVKLTKLYDRIVYNRQLSKLSTTIALSGQENASTITANLWKQYRQTIFSLFKFRNSNIEPVVVCLDIWLEPWNYQIFQLKLTWFELPTEQNGDSPRKVVKMIKTSIKHSGKSNNLPKHWNTCYTEAPILQ